MSCSARGCGHTRASWVTRAAALCSPLCSNCPPVSTTEMSLAVCSAEDCTAGKASAVIARRSGVPRVMLDLRGLSARLRVMSDAGPACYVAGLDHWPGMRVLHSCNISTGVTWQRST